VRPTIAHAADMAGMCAAGVGGAESYLNRDAGGTQAGVPPARDFGVRIVDC
jgi:hypothetical protein